MYRTTPVQPFPPELADKFSDPVFVASGSTSMIFIASFAVPDYRDYPLPDDNKRFAVKIPFIDPKTVAPTARGYSLKEFYREVDALEKHHPHVVKYHSFMVEPVCCMVMEYVRGRPLSRCARELGDYGLIGVLKDLAHAVTEMHENNFVCGSISLDDIIVRNVSSDQEGNRRVRPVYRAKLVDLGGAQSLRSDEITRKQRELLRATDILRLMFTYRRIVSLAAKAK